MPFFRIYNTIKDHKKLGVDRDTMGHNEESFAVFQVGSNLITWTGVERTNRNKFDIYIYIYLV